MMPRATSRPPSRPSRCGIRIIPQATGIGPEPVGRQWHIAVMQMPRNPVSHRSPDAAVVGHRERDIVQEDHPTPRIIGRSIRYV